MRDLDPKRTGTGDDVPGQVTEREAWGAHAAEALNREKALTFAAVAASAWCSRTAPDPVSGRDLLRCLMDASAWGSRHRRQVGLGPISVAELSEAFVRPIDEWLPGAGGFPLVEHGEPTPLCVELTEVAGVSVGDEIEQRVIKQAMLNLAGQSDGAAKYTAFRRFLVENPVARREDAARIMRSVGLELSSVYGPVPQTARFSSDGGDVLFSCPRCRWPMSIRGDSVSCARSVSCLGEGARFTVKEGALVALGRRPAPRGRSCRDFAVVTAGVWRYTVLPGIEELLLAENLAKIRGARVELWPFIDAYDLDVAVGDERWRVDVKDHVSSVGLARHLAENPAREPTWIVVPDRRRDQVFVLRQLVPPSSGYSFSSSSDFVRRAKETR